MKRALAVLASGLAISLALAGCTGAGDSSAEGNKGQTVKRGDTDVQSQGAADNAGGADPDSNGGSVDSTDVNGAGVAGEQTGAPVDETSKEILSANDVLTLLSKHNSVSIKMENYTQDKTVDTVYNYEFFNTPAGVCSIQRTESPELGSTYTVYSYISEGSPGVILSDMDASMEGETERTIILCPSKDYPYLATRNNSSPDYSNMGGETIAEESENRDGRLFVTTKTTIPDMPFYVRDVYNVDPETKEMSGRETTSYSVSDNSVQWSSRTTAVYDADHGTLDAQLLDKCINAPDGCKLKLVINPGKPGEETQNYTVARDCIVYFQCGNGSYGLFSDPECKTQINYIDTSGNNFEVYAVEASG